MVEVVDSLNSIEKTIVQPALDRFLNREVYLHLETTNGAYAVHSQQSNMSAGAYIRNGRISFSRGIITGDGPYRVGLKLELGWVYAEGLTDFEITPEGQFLLAGHDEEGRLAVALELSMSPFE